MITEADGCEDFITIQGLFLVEDIYIVEKQISKQKKLYCPQPFNQQF